MSSVTTPSRLLIIGGAEDREGPCVILREFVALAGGADARLVVIPAASGSPEAVGGDYTRLFERLGVAAVSVLTLSDRSAAQREASVRQIKDATGVFFTGGDQLRIMNRLGGTGVDTVLHQRVAEGLVVGGTSAGAAVMSATMIIEGETRSPRAGAVRTGPGLEFLPGIIIDQHFAQRGRIGRLLSVVAQFPHQLGIGIDEDTALVVEGSLARVIGSGSITIVDAGATTFNDGGEVGPGEAISLCGVTLHSLPSGRSFDLRGRQPIFDTPPLSASQSPCVS